MSNPDWTDPGDFEDTPEGWYIYPEFLGYVGVHADFDASYEGPEDGWVGNGLQCHGDTRGEVIEMIYEIEADHPHFKETAK